MSVSGLLARHGRAVGFEEKSVPGRAERKPSGSPLKRGRGP